MMNVMDDTVDDEHAGIGTNGYLDELFETLHSELYLGVLSFSSLNFLVKLMHIKVVNKWTNKFVNDLLKLLKLAFPNMNLETLREQQEHVCRVGRVPKGTSPFLDSIATSNTLREHSTSFVKTLVIMENLEQRLPEVVPYDNEEVGEDENDGGGLGDV
ncbi:Transpos assoc domain-containing protein [Abeliophyllum distichum]|uniref:Transpos assoc domain-containing protein n=1 Tax=Abeliophyllum distichum TaxID=126358 RepID=A0ABD1UM18_9LAMI